MSSWHGWRLALKDRIFHKRNKDFAYCLRYPTIDATKWKAEPAGNHGAFPKQPCKKNHPIPGFVFTKEHWKPNISRESALWNEHHVLFSTGHVTYPNSNNIPTMTAMSHHKLLDLHKRGWQEVHHSFPKFMPKWLEWHTGIPSRELIYPTWGKKKIIFKSALKREYC